MAHLLTAADPPTAVFAQSDEMAIGALEAAREAGLRVPDDISIVGFDDHDMAAFASLTTVAQPALQQGETAAMLLLDRMTDGGGSRETTSVVMPTRVIVRATTGPDRSGRAQLAATK
jgi:DNA-binding LacI/PurR family transcriptional regulator